jgi:hypothetical protein
MLYAERIARTGALSPRHELCCWTPNRETNAAQAGVW